MSDLPEVPADFEVKVLKDGEPAKDRVTCGTCGRSWDDAIITGWTPAPSARCPFEYYHADREEEPMFDLTEYRDDGSFFFGKLYGYTKTEAIAKVKALPNGGALYDNAGKLVHQEMPPDEEEEIDDRDESPVEFSESAEGERAREKWAKRHDDLNGAPEGDHDR